MSLRCEPPLQHGPHKGESATGTRSGYLRHYKAGEDACDPCLAAWAEANKTWTADHPESRRRTKAKRRPQDAALARDARARDPEKHRAARRRSERRHPDKRRERARRWRALNVQAAREIDARRRARLREALTIPFTVDQLAARMAYWGNRCWMCHGPFEQYDHVIPISRGGAHCIANFRPACKSCNCSKKDRDWPLFGKVA